MLWWKQCVSDYILHSCGGTLHQSGAFDCGCLFTHLQSLCPHCVYFQAYPHTFVCLGPLQWNVWRSPAFVTTGYFGEGISVVCWQRHQIVSSAVGIRDHDRLSPSALHWHLWNNIPLHSLFCMELWVWGWGASRTIQACPEEEMGGKFNLSPKKPADLKTPSTRPVKTQKSKHSRPHLAYQSASKVLSSQLEWILCLTWHWIATGQRTSKASPGPGITKPSKSTQ